MVYLAYNNLHHDLCCKPTINAPGDNLGKKKNLNMKQILLFLVLREEVMF